MGTQLTRLYVLYIYIYTRTHYSKPSAARSQSLTMLKQYFILSRTTQTRGDWIGSLYSHSVVSVGEIIGSAKTEASSNFVRMRTNTRAFSIVLVRAPRDTVRAIPCPRGRQRKCEVKK